ncbi:MAG: PAS domain S-box protein [Thermodesulfobacteriota bacterium]
MTQEQDQAQLLDELQELRRRLVHAEAAEERRRQAELALRDSEELFRATFEQAAAGICHTDPWGNYLRVNQRMCEMLGFTREELLKLSFQKVVHPDDLEEGVRLTGRLLSGEIDSYCSEKRYLNKTGAEVWVNRTVSLVRDKNGRPKYFISVLEDITKRKMAEKALRESEQRYALAVEAGKVGVWDWDLQSGAIYLDPLLKALLGYADQEIANHIDAWSRLVHPEDRAAVRQAAQAHLSGGAPRFEAVHRMCHKDGGVRWFQTSGSVIKNAEGVPWRMVGTHTDVSERKEAEEELKKHRNQLEELVRQRTAELQQKNQELTTQAHKLAELNAALKVLLEQREKDRGEIEAKIVTNLTKLVYPYLEKLQSTRLDDDQKMLLDIAWTNLKEVTSSFIPNLATTLINFTPREIEVANLVARGKTNKEIAEVLNLSVRSVEFHRDHIRKKLGLRQKKINLRTYLDSLS